MRPITAGFAAALDDLANNREPRGGVRRADVDPSEFIDYFKDYGYLLEVDLTTATAYWHTPNDDDTVNSQTVQLSSDQLSAARRCIAADGR